MIQITTFCSFKISITFNHAVAWKTICFCSWLYNIPSCEYTIIYLYIWRPILLIFHLRFSQKRWLFSFYPTLKNRQSNVYSRSLSLKRFFFVALPLIYNILPTNDLYVSMSITALLIVAQSQIFHPKHTNIHHVPWMDIWTLWWNLMLHFSHPSVFVS